MAKINVKIDVSAVLAPIVSSRDVLEVLKKKIEKTAVEQVDLDFSNVEFLSRSAAHELLKIKEYFKNKVFRKKTINFISANDGVAEMLRVVASNRAFPKKQEQLKIERVTIGSLLF